MMGEIAEKVDRRLKGIPKLRKEYAEEDLKVMSVERQMAEIKDTVYKMKDEKHDEIDKLEREMNEALMSKKKYDQGIHKIDKLEKELDEEEAEIDKLEREMNEALELKKYHEEENKKISYIKKQIEDIKNFGKNLSEDLEEATAEMIAEKLSIIEKKSEEISSLKKYHEDENIRIASIERDVSEFKKEIEEFKDLAKKAEQHVGKETLQTMDSKLQHLGNKVDEIAEMKKTQKKDADYTNLKAHIDQGKQSRTALEIKMKVLEEYVKKMPIVRETVKDTGSAPVSEEVFKLKTELINQKQAIKDMEKTLETQAIKFFAANLEDFAKTLEKRFPKMVKEDQYSKDINSIQKQMHSIESPDMSILAQRIDKLESHISEIQSLMKIVSTRVPYIVE